MSKFVKAAIAVSLAMPMVALAGGAANAFDYPAENDCNNGRPYGAITRSPSPDAYRDCVGLDLREPQNNGGGGGGGGGGAGAPASPATGALYIQRTVANTATNQTLFCTGNVANLDNVDTLANANFVVTNQAGAADTFVTAPITDSTGRVVGVTVTRTQNGGADTFRIDALCEDSRPPGI